MRPSYSFGPIVASLLATTTTAALDASVDVEIGKAAKPELKILPLGASIVFGIGTDAGNSFREPLREQLVSQGYEVDMVGTKKCGTMKDNECEATPGFILTEVHTASKLSYKYKPNMVLINAGTNDIVRSINVTQAQDRLESIIDDLWSNVSNETVIVVSTLLPIDNTVAEKNRAIVNPSYRRLVRQLQLKDKPVYLADMDPAIGTGITLDDLVDGTHPGEHGAEVMADIFWAAIKKAASDGKIKDPID